MGLGSFAEKMMAMDDATWARHANPISGWSRVTILPLLALAVWARIWIGWWSLAAVAVLIGWTWLNPRLFSAPASTDNWMSRVVLGERVWLAAKTAPIPAHHARVTRILNIAASLGALILAIGLWRLDFGLVLAGLIAAMGAKLWFGDRMVWLLQDSRNSAPAP
jgi:Family of unknown function (DUF6653)